MTNTTKKLIATTALSFASLAGFAGIAGADTIAPAPQPGPGPIIANPTPEPQPDPPAPEPELPIAQPEPTDPTPDFPIAQPEPEPFDPPIGVPTPDEDPEPEPQVPTNDDLEADLGCQFTHGCEDDGSIDDFTSAGDDGSDPTGDVDGDGCVEIIGGPEVCPEETPGDEPGETPGDDTPADEPGTKGGSLPRTGAGVALLAAVGSALTAAGLAAKKLARR